MEVNNNFQKIAEENGLEPIKEVTKENKIKDSDINDALTDKSNKDNLPKNKENLKNKIINKNNEKEPINERGNNFINFTNSNIQHNRYYSTISSNHKFKNFVMKSNYNNKNRDNYDINNEQNNSDIT